MTTTTQQVTCPGRICTCGGSQTVTVKYGHDRRTGRATATYSPCAALIAQGWTGRVAEVLWVDEPVATVLRHRDGLVTFAV